MSNEGKEAKDVCFRFVRYLSGSNWDGLQNLLADEFSAWLPQRNENIEGVDQYVENLKNRPRFKSYQIYNTTVEYDVWEKNYSVAFQVCIMDEETSRPTCSFHLMFIRVDREEMIDSITEFECPETK